MNRNLEQVFGIGIGGPCISIVGKRWNEEQKKTGRSDEGKFIALHTIQGAQGRNKKGERVAFIGLISSFRGLEFRSRLGLVSGGKALISAFSMLCRRALTRGGSRSKG